MDQIKLEELVTGIANGLLGEGEIIDFANDYRVTYIELYFKDDVGHAAHAELFHQGRHGDDREGKYPNATLEEAADACVQLLRPLRDFRDIACTNNLHAIFIALRRLTVRSEVTRYLYSVGDNVDEPTPDESVPDDPLIVF